MQLALFRNHLSEELARFPKVTGPSMQSYAVTTAVLARRIIAYAGVRDLTMPGGLFRGESYRVDEVLNRIIHFTVLHQDSMTFGLPDDPDIVTLYSDWAKHPADEHYIRVSDYMRTGNGAASNTGHAAASAQPLR